MPAGLATKYQSGEVGNEIVIERRFSFPVSANHVLDLRGIGFASEQAPLQNRVSATALGHDGTIDRYRKLIQPP